MFMAVVIEEGVPLAVPDGAAPQGPIHDLDLELGGEAAEHALRAIMPHVAGLGLVGLGLGLELGLGPGIGKAR
jgi:hypothetical protein